MRFKTVMRADEIQGHFRLFRALWTHGTVGDGSGYSVKLSFALTPRLIGWCRDGRHDWFLYFLGLRVHYCRSYAGVMV